MALGVLPPPPQAPKEMTLAIASTVGAVRMWPPVSRRPVWACDSAIQRQCVDVRQRTYIFLGKLFQPNRHGAHILVVSHAVTIATFAFHREQLGEDVERGDVW